MEFAYTVVVLVVIAILHTIYMRWNNRDIRILYRRDEENTQRISELERRIEDLEDCQHDR